MRITSILPVVMWTPLVLLALATAGFPGRCAAQPHHESRSDPGPNQMEDIGA